MEAAKGALVGIWPRQSQSCWWWSRNCDWFCQNPPVSTERGWGWPRSGNPHPRGLWGWELLAEPLEPGLGWECGEGALPGSRCWCLLPWGHSRAPRGTCRVQGHSRAPKGDLQRAGTQQSTKRDLQGHNRASRGDLQRGRTQQSTKRGSAGNRDTTEHPGGLAGTLQSTQGDLQGH